ncbi:MAG: hypothetical protein PVH29_09225 [Candidatus Zixiibacteriota bacterium]|jgi:tetratricopeptide (TPR) repeat protein
MKYERPENEHDFEEFCLVLFRDVCELPQLERYGHRGEAQYGIDLIDESGKTPLVVFQCKYREPYKSFPPRELKAEVEKARRFHDKIRNIDKYVVLTTGKISNQTQNTLLELNAAHIAEGLFNIRILTWDRLEKLIDRSRDAREYLGYPPDKVPSRTAREEVLPLEDIVRDLADDKRQTRLDEVKAVLDQGNPREALMLVQRLRARLWTGFEPVEKARLLTLQAASLLRIGDHKEAAKLFIEARGYNPDDERAMTNEAVGRHILGETERASAIAEEARSRFPNSVSAYAACIEFAVSTGQAEALIQSLPTEMHDNLDILIAIATRHDLGELGQDSARRGTEVDPNDYRAWFLLANILLDEEYRKVNPFSSGIVERPSTTKLSEAYDAYSKVIELSEVIGHDRLKVLALLRRVMTSNLLKDERLAREDIELAYRLAPDDPEVLIIFARIAGKRGDHETAVETLRRALLINPNEEVRFSLAISLWHRNGPGDREEATGIMTEIAEDTGPHSEAALGYSVDGLLFLGKSEEASDLIKRFEATVDPVLINTLRARVAISHDEETEALTSVSKGSKAVTESTSRDTVKNLAVLLITLNRYEDAFVLLECIANPGIDEETDYHIVTCANRLKRDKYVLDYCERARERGVYNDYLLGQELQLLSRYDQEKAISILSHMLSRNPEDHRARVNLVTLALQYGKRELAEKHVPLLPKVTEVDAQEGAAVVSILREFDEGHRAIYYAYDLLRRFFPDHHAHRAFWGAMIFRGSEGEFLAAPDVIVPGVAVCLTEEGTNESRWSVLEDSVVEASGVEYEIKADSPLAKILLGKRVGDKVALSEEPGVPRTTIVKKVLSKYVFRFRDVLDQWQYRFPDHTELWAVRVRGEDGAPDLDGIRQILQRQRERQDAVEELYREKLVPVGAFAELLGTNEVRATGHVANTEGLQLKCCGGSKEELGDALTAFGNASEVVVELSALTTLCMLNEICRFETLEKKFLISQSSMAVIQTFIKGARPNPRHVGRLGSTSEGSLLFLPNEESDKEKIEFLDGVQRFLQDRFTTISAPELAGMDADEREQFEEVIGIAALESVAIASYSNRILWTDDGVLTRLARDRFVFQRIWTQAGFRWMLDERYIDDDVFARVCAKLIGWDYMFTGANRIICRAAGELADWEPEVYPLKQTIAYLGLPELSIEYAIQLGVLLGSDAYTGATLPTTRRMILLNVLGTIARRPDCTDRNLSSFGRLLPRYFGLNVIGQEDAVKTFEAWRRTGGQGLIRP